MISFTDARKQSNQGILLYLHVIPGASQTMFPVRYNPWRKSIEIKVKSEAKDNKANTEIITTVAKFFDVSIKDVVLVNGEKKKEKTICVKSISLDAVDSKIKESLHG